VRRRLKAEHDVKALKGKVTAKASGTSDFITISTEARSPKAAVNLANAYAQAFILRAKSSYERAIRAQIATSRAQLRRIEPTPGSGKGKASSGAATIQAANLASKISQLETSLTTSAGVQQVSPAKANPLPVSPKPKTNAIFAFVLALILASIAAYILGRYDRRLGSLSRIEAVFGTQILAALPAVRSPTVRPDGRRAPARSLLEPLRRLQTTLQLGDMLELGPERAPRVILFLSADAGDGNSSIIANLARVQADGGERVAIIEADFRRPTQAVLLDVSGPYGLADALTGKVPAADAWQAVKLTSPADDAAGPADGASAVSTVVESPATGSVSVLVGGGTVSNPPALLAGAAMAELILSARETYDYVLIDAPPPLEVSDAMPLLQRVDGVVLVARIGHTRDSSAERLAQLLRRTASAPLLGAVGNCVPRRDVERYGFTWAPVEQRRRKLIGR